MNALQLEGGFHAGPLFVIQKRRAARVRPSGGKEVWRKYSRAKPPWQDWKSVNEFWDKSKELTALTGIQHSVDHIVPLVHPLVCGLHVPCNLRVVPLADNIRKSNNHWPHMPMQQLTLTLTPMEQVE